MDLPASKKYSIIKKIGEIQRNKRAFNVESKREKLDRKEKISEFDVR